MYGTADSIKAFDESKPDVAGNGESNTFDVEEDDDDVEEDDCIRFSLL